jgi:hypothetical protein
MTWRLTPTALFHVEWRISIAKLSNRIECSIHEDNAVK